MTEVGPRKLYYRSSDGKEGEITITATLKQGKSVQFDDGDAIPRRNASMSIVSDWFSYTLSFPAEDDLQGLFRIMVLTDIYIQKICRDNDCELYSVVPGDVVADLDIFR